MIISTLRVITTITCATLMLAIFGCASRSTFLKATASFSEGYDTTSSTIGSILGTASQDARVEAFGYYMQNGNKSTNLHNDYVTDSFIRYVCAGFGKHVKEYSALGALKTYNRTIGKVSAEPSDKYGELISSIKGLDKPLPLIELPKDGDAQKLFQRCQNIVTADLRLSPIGEVISEMVEYRAVFDEIKGTVDILRTAAITVLKIVDDAKRAEALRRYIKDNAERVETLFDNLEQTNIEVAWRQHRKALLVVPFLRFKYMLTSLDRTNDVAKILETEQMVRNGLEPYDVMLVSAAPKGLIKKMKKAQEELIRLANNDLSPGEAWALLSEFADNAEAIGKAYEEVSAAVDSL